MGGTPHHPMQEEADAVVVRLGGTGGQGLVLMGHLLAEALALHDDLNVVMTKSYGPEARGGASRSDVVVSSGPIDDIGGTEVDILVCLSQQACDKYYPDLVPNGVLIVDTTNVGVVPTSRAVEAPLSELAVEKCGNRMVTNVVGLGMLCGYTGVVSPKALKAAITETVREEFRKSNTLALELGIQLGADALAEVSPKHRAEMHDYARLRNA